MSRPERRRDILWGLLLTVAVRLLMAGLTRRPGYTDTAYYAAGAIRIARGYGFTEPFIWNYLTDPAGIPHPGFLYWMPLPSLLAAAPAALFGTSFFVLQLPFVILSSGIPILAYILTQRATENRRLAQGAGLVAIFGGFFFPYWTLPETFAPFALFGALALHLAGCRGMKTGARRLQSGRSFVAGLLVGLGHLTRADGFLLLPLIALAPLTGDQIHPTADGTGNRERPDTSNSSHPGRRKAVRVGLVVLGYALVMAPWMARTVAVAGTPLSAAGAKTVWLTEYDDLFCYNCALTPASYLAWGWPNIMRSKLVALWINFQRFLAEDCLIVLFPLVILGLYRLRHRVDFRLASLYLGVIYLTHSLIFTFPGWRGGFFHASSAALPFVYTASMSGLDGAVAWATRRRKRWRHGEAVTVFTAAVVTIAALISGYVAWQRIPTWREANSLHERVDHWLAENDEPGASVMAGDAPAFWYHTRRPAAAIPNGDVETILEVADRYDLRYLLLEANHPSPLADLYAGRTGHPRLSEVEKWGEAGAVLYAIRRPEDASSIETDPSLTRRVVVAGTLGKRRSLAAQP